MLAVWYNIEDLDGHMKKLSFLQTASLGIFAGLNIDVPNAKSLPSSKDEWIVVLGGSTSVGKFAVQVCTHDFRSELATNANVQLAKLCGFKVIGSASESSSSVSQN